MTLFTIRPKLSIQNTALISLLHKETSCVLFHFLNFLSTFYTQLCHRMIIHTGQSWSHKQQSYGSQKQWHNIFMLCKISCSHWCKNETRYIKKQVIPIFSAYVIIIIIIKNNKYVKQNILNFLCNHKYWLYNMAGIWSHVFVFPKLQKKKNDSNTKLFVLFTGSWIVFRNLYEQIVIFYVNINLTCTISTVTFNINVNQGRFRKFWISEAETISNVLFDYLF